MNLADFDFELPRELIAQTPASPRESARLLVYERSSRKITDDYFYNLGKHLVPGTSLVMNDSKVEKCRLRFGKTEIFVLETVNPTTVKVLVKPGKKFSLGTKIKLGDLEAEVLAVEEGGLRLLSLDRPIDDKSLDKHRLTPFPPYIAQNEKLASEYQTVYAKPLGSKAAPTAGLHFSKKMLSELNHKHNVIYITLHVGLGTFAPLKLENVKSGKLHEEHYEISQHSADLLNSAKHITAVGTTTTRVLECVERPFKPTNGTTDIFITPGHTFKAVDSLVTNFHLPKSSLLMLVSALVGSVDEMQRVYAHAVAKKYRLYSFGDAMLIL